jgi:hypothetical protein
MLYVMCAWYFEFILLLLVSSSFDFDSIFLFFTFLQVGRTEVIQDNLNPDFAQKFIMSYFFEESQRLKFEM